MAITSLLRLITKLKSLFLKQSPVLEKMTLQNGTNIRSHLFPHDVLQLPSLLAEGLSNFSRLSLGLYWMHD